MIVSGVWRLGHQRTDTLGPFPSTHLRREADVTWNMPAQNLRHTNVTLVVWLSGLNISSANFKTAASIPAEVIHGHRHSAPEHLTSGCAKGTVPIRSALYVCQITTYCWVWSLCHQRTDTLGVSPSIRLKTTMASHFNNIYLYASDTYFWSTNK